MNHTRKKTTRHIVGEDENGLFEEFPMIDEALQMLTWKTTGQTTFSGKIVTHWVNGGLRTPSVNWCKKERKKIIEAPMLEVINQTDTGFTGKVIYRMNNGEMSGQPEVSSNK